MIAQSFKPRVQGSIPCALTSGGQAYVRLASFVYALFVDALTGERRLR